MTITSRSRLVGGIALVGTGALLLAGCASAPTASPSESGSASGSAAALDFLPCMVSDAGGFDDKGFNQLGFEGLKEAAGKLGVKYNQAESKDETDYAPNIDSMVDAGCNLIITVGFNLSAATVTAAQANPDVDFAIIDDAADNDQDGKTDAPNIRPILFDTSQAAFLAGYAAASYSKTGVIGTFGGQPYPTVTVFMDGFAQGAAYFNTEKKKDVKVVGWDSAKQDGVFTKGFEANETAKTAAQGLIDQDADVILPVGGPINQSAGAAIEDSGKDITLIGVDSDAYTALPDYKGIALTSILKGIKPATEDVITSASTGDFDATPYVGTLENDGVGLAPFHDFESKVGTDLQGELDTIKASIISGDIKVTSYLAG